jgi:hypothetical protein
LGVVTLVLTPFVWLLRQAKTPAGAHAAALE